MDDEDDITQPRFITSFLHPTKKNYHDRVERIELSVSEIVPSHSEEDTGRGTRDAKTSQRAGCGLIEDGVEE
jgi:hypothetical protein